MILYKELDITMTILFQIVNVYSGALLYKRSNLFIL